MEKKKKKLRQTTLKQVANHADKVLTIEAILIKFQENYRLKRLEDHQQVCCERGDHRLTDNGFCFTGLHVNVDVPI